MLNYLILTTEGLLLAVVLIALLYAWVCNACGEEYKKFLHIGALVGLVAAMAMAILKNTTSLIATGTWNVRIFTVSLAALLLFAISAVPAVGKAFGVRKNAFRSAVAAIMVFTLVFYVLPDILAYPFNFPLGGASVFSSAFFTRFAGWILGLILSYLIFIGTERVAERSERGILNAILGLVLIINALLQISKILQILYTRRKISGHWIFVIIRETSNHSKWFIYAALIVAVVLPTTLVIRSFRVREPYENSAQHRKIRAKWRNARRWSTLMAAAFVCGVLCITLLDALNNQTIELSPIEDSELRGDNIYVSLTQVEDGHLHRFAYTTPDDITVRFIVIKKPNSSSYGVGLDACDICGETGYFERNGQIVCKLCDVVMNINTIGFKGGCNPIVIDYSVENGYIIVPTYTLTDHQSEFK